MDEIDKLLEDTQTQVDLMGVQGDKTLELINYERSLILIMKGTIGRPNIHRNRILFKQSLKNLQLDMLNLRDIWGGMSKNLTAVLESGGEENDEGKVARAKFIMLHLKTFNEKWMTLKRNPIENIL